MAFKVTESEQKIVAPKRTIKIVDVNVKDLKFVDESGDITEMILDEIPDGINTVSFNITVELPAEE